MPPVLKSVPKRSLGAKFSSPLERLATMKSNKVDFASKVGPRPIHLVVEIGSPAEKEEIARVCSCEKFTKPFSGEVTEIYAFFKPYLLKDMDECVKLVDGFRGVLCPSSFAKHATQYRMTALLAMMQKTTILEAKSMFLDQEDTKVAKEMAKTMAAEAYSFAKNIIKLESELVVLKGSNISAPTSLQLETACR